MNFGEMFKAFTIYTLMCRRGYPLRQKILIGFIKISQFTLVAFGESGPPEQMASYAPAVV